VLTSTRVFFNMPQDYRHSAKNPRAVIGAGIVVAVAREESEAYWQLSHCRRSMGSTGTA
jgi:hypothetical protein